MKEHFVHRSSFMKMLSLLRCRGELHAPVAGDDGIVRFARLSPDTLPDLKAVRTQLPPKKYLLHPRETILNYTPEHGYQQASYTTPPLILFGVHPCDLAGISYLDRLYLNDTPDPLYAARRAAVTLIGSSCTPDEFCSCQDYPSPLQASCDLFLQQTDDGCIVSTASLHGDDLLELIRKVVVERELTVPADTRRFFGQPPTLSPAPERDATLPDWQELAEHCLGCGACSHCCPTCSCFDVLESGGLDGSSAERVRRWDNCLFSSHAQVAGGVSFQKERAERFRYRYRHKYRGFGQLQGIPGCVGCGRCRAVCPTGLDLRPLALRLEGGAS